MIKLFSYGTLQLSQVQIDTFGRILSGTKDRLQKYIVSNLKITDQKVIKSSGTDIHPILIFTGKETDFVEGTLFLLSKEELLQADKYEVDDYKRSQLKFESGEMAFVYLKNEK